MSAASSTTRAGLGEILSSLLQAATAELRRVREKRRRQRDAQSAFEQLYELDDRTLRDLGIHREEIWSLVAEMSGAAQATRRRTHRESR